MFAVSMAIFACVLAALACGAAALLILRVSGLQRYIDARCNGLLQTVERSSQTALKAELDALAAALETTRASNRKEFGSLWGRLGGAPLPRDPEKAAWAKAGDEELQEMLAFQAQSTPKQ